MKRRILSAFLLVVMLISLMPAQAFAAEPTAADMSGTTMTVGGDSSFGNLLGNTVNSEQSRTGGENFTAGISELTVEGTKAVVEYSINAPATVVVAIYSDDGFTMLGSGTAEAQPDGTWVAVDIEIAKMPKYFTAGAFMLDPETNNPVSEEYKTTRYTKAYMDIKAATVDDFDPELVLNLDNDRTTNFAVFNENTILADAASGVSVTELGSGIYRIDNPNDSILAMQAGDRFAYTYADGNVLIVCAAYVGTGVDEKGTYVLITEQADAELADVFDFVKIETDSFDKEVSYDESTLSEGVKMVDPAEIDQLYDAGTMGLGDRAIVDEKTEKSASIGYKLNKTFYEEGSVSVKFTGGLKFSFTASLEVFISLNYQNVTFSFEQETSVSVSVTGKFEPKIPFAKTKIKFLPGISAEIKPSFVFKFSASVDWTVKLKNSIKYMYDSDTGTTYSKSGPTLKNEVAVKGKLFVGINLDISINVISKKILSGGIELEDGVEISMKETIDPISSKDTGRIHECSVCFEGEVDKVFSLTAYLDILKSRKAELTLHETKSKISDCYRSFDFDEFGFTKCPHVSYKVSVQLLKGGKAVSACVPVELYHDGQLVDSVYVLDDDLKPVKSAPLTDSAFYLPNGKYTVAVELDGSRQEKEFTVSNNGKELRLVFPDDASDYPFTLSDTSLNLSKGDIHQLIAFYYDKKVPASCVWSTSNAKVAEVKNGIVTAKNNGDAVITASYSVGGLTYSASCQVKVSKIDVIASGKCGDNLTWTLDDEGTLTISGTGRMNNYSSGYRPWETQKDKITKLIIGDDVTNIGSGAFYSCNKLTSATIGSSVASIDNFAFNYCTGLTSVTIPDSVTVIEYSAFAYCRNLANVTMGNGVTRIGAGAFGGCGFTSITIPDSVTNIDGNVFSYCSSLTRIDVASANENYTSIDGVLYSKDVTELITCPAGRTGSYEIPDSVTTIGYQAFNSCTGLTSVTIPDSVTSVGVGAFSGCSALTDVYYTGTQEQWKTISIGSLNDPLTNAEIHYGEIEAGKMSVLSDAEPEEPTEEDEEPLPEIEVEAEEELIIEELPIEESPADEALEEAPVESATAAIEPVAAHKGTSGTKGKFRTAKFTNLEPGEEYVLIVSVDPTALLKPANLLYIAQDNAAADGTLTLSYIPRTETPSASVTLYGVPRDRKISLDREYLALQAGDGNAHLGAEVFPNEWSKYLTWRADNPDGEEIISVSASGDVTPLAVGTAYAVAEVSHKGYTFTARCRVDVSEKSIEEEIEISGVQLGTSAVTSELYSRKYAEFDLLLLLPQNVSTMSAESAEKPEDNGIAIKNARFADVSAQKIFDLVVTDDRRIAVVPKDSTVENAKTVKSSYTSAVIVTVGNTEFVTDAKLKLTVKKTMPKLKAETVQFNSFYSSQSAPIVISGAAVTAIRPDTAKKLAVPAWLTLTDGQLALNNAPQKSASGSVYVLAETEEWVVPAAVTVSVRNTYKAPKLKLSAASVTFSNTASGGTVMTLMPNAKNETLEQYNVTDLVAANGFTVEGFDAETGAFTLKAPEGYKSGKTTLAVSFGDTDTTVSLPLTVKTAAPTVKLKKTSVTLNPAHGDIAEIDMTVTPADYIGVLDVSVTNASGTEVTELDTWLADGKLYVHTVDATKYNTTYKVSVSVPGTTGRPAVLTVRTNKENMKPSVTVKAAGAIDLTYPDSAVTVTPTFKNFNGGFTVTGGRVTETKGRTAISEGDLDTYFTVTQTGNTIRLEKAENAYLTAGNTYTAQLTLSIAGMELTASAKITVKATAVSLRLSKSALTLNKLVNDASSVTVTCTTKNYVLGEPVISVMDKTGKNSAEGKLDTSYSGGTLYVSVNEATEYGTSYKVLVSAGEGHRAATLTVTVPAKAKSAVSSTVRAAGSIDVLRGGSSITLTPTYRSALTTAYTERVEVYSSADGFRSPVDGVFAVDGRVLTNISADSTLKYKVKVITTFENGYETASPLTAITVKAGSARMTASGASALYLKDANSRGSFTVASSDLTLNGVARAEIKDAKNAAMFELYDYGNGEFAIGFKDGRVSAAAAKLKSASVAINVWVEGAPSAKPTATVTLKLNIVK